MNSTTGVKILKVNYSERSKSRVEWRNGGLNGKKKKKKANKERPTLVKRGQGTLRRFWGSAGCRFGGISFVIHVEPRNGVMEAAMITGQITDFKSLGQFVGVMLAGFVLGAAFSTLNGLDTVGCGVFGLLERMGLEVLRTAVNATIWQAVTSHSCQAASCLPELLQNGTHIWSLLCQVGAGF